MKLKNTILQAATALIRPYIQRSNEQEPKRILVISTTGLGDTLWATPALLSLRKSFPESFIGVVTSPIGSEVLKYNPHVDRLFTIHEPWIWSFFPLWKQLYANHFDTVLIFHASQRLAVPLASLIGAIRVIGSSQGNKGMESLLTQALAIKKEHEIVRRLNMIEAIGGSVYDDTLSLFLQPEELLAKRPGLWVAVHPGSKDRFKRWPASHFADVARSLQKKTGCNILVTGTPEESELMQYTASLIPGAHVSDARLPFRSFAALIKTMDLLICNDSGPFHTACAVGAPVIGIYSPTDPSECGPYRANQALAMQKKPSCKPCLKRKCNHSFCLLQIGTAEVCEAASAFLLK